MITSSKPNKYPDILDQTFHHDTASHSFTVKWGSIGVKTSPPVVFIHGTPWSSAVWIPFAISLSRRFRVYLLDRPGFGESPPEAHQSSYDATKDSAVEKLDADLARQSEVFAALYKLWQSEWDTEQPAAHVVAHDNAGLLSLRAHLLHGCKYASLCLMNVVAIGPFGQSLFKAVGDSPELFEELPDMALEGILEAYIRDAAHQELSKNTMDMLKEPWLRPGGKKGFIRELRQANVRSTDAVESRYGQVGPSIPVKIIWGAQDNWIPVASAWRLGKALGTREIVEIPEAGHLVMIDQPGQVGVELGMWLSSATQKSGRPSGSSRIME